MEDFDEPRENYWRPKWPLYTVVALLLGATAISLAYLYRERQQARELAATNQTLSASLVQLQNQLMVLNQRMEQVGQERAPKPPAATVVRSQAAKAPAANASKRATRATRATQGVPREDPRFKELQGRLSDQQKELASAREDLNKTREDLSGALNNTRDELSGSIARTHEELVALQKRGERNYYEFELNKSKQFQRVGSLRISLRKADTKHKRFDVNMFVDDNELQKKGVNLYETIWINTGDSPQPMELVVNQITKDHIQGYLSESKFKKSELRQTADAARP